MIKRLGKILFLLLAIAVIALVAWGYSGDRTVAELRARWAPAPSEFKQIDGLEVHLRDQGPRDDALPVLLLHGTSASLHTWEGWARAIAQTRRVISIDLPGFGLTGPNVERDYRTERYVRHVLAVLDHLAIKRVVLAGNSLGGEIAWHTALADRGRVAALVLVDPAGMPLAAKSIPIGFRMAANPLLAPLLTVLTPRSVVAQSVRSTYGDPAKVTDATIDRYYELTLRTGNRQALVDRFKQMRFGDRIDGLKSIEIPTLILWGAQDQLIPVDNARLFADAIPNSEVAIFENLGHIPQEEDPQQSVAPVLRFLETRACANCGVP